MKVESVEFRTRLRLPDGHYEQSISLKNKPQERYRVAWDGDVRLLVVEADGKTPSDPPWRVCVPAENVVFFIPVKAAPVAVKKAG